MRKISAILLVGAAVLSLGAFVLPAASKGPAIHEMTVQLPGGGTETIRYTGDVAPKVSIVRASLAVVWPAPIELGWEPSFGAFDRIAAEMNRQMDALLRQARTVAPWSATNDLSQAALNDLGAGGSAYTVVSETFGNSVCTRMTQITTPPNGGKPKVVSQTSGNCNASPTGAGTAPNPASVQTTAVHGAVAASAVAPTSL
jgi:hypothetical protein